MFLVSLISVVVAIRAVEPLEVGEDALGDVNEHFCGGRGGIHLIYLVIYEYLCKDG